MFCNNNIMRIVAEASKRGNGMPAISATSQPKGYQVNFVWQREYVILLLFRVIINQAFSIIHFQMLPFWMQFQEYAVALWHYVLLFFSKRRTFFVCLLPSSWFFFVHINQIEIRTNRFWKIKYYLPQDNVYINF